MLCLHDTPNAVMLWQMLAVQNWGLKSCDILLIKFLQPSLSNTTRRDIHEKFRCTAFAFQGPIVAGLRDARRESQQQSTTPRLSFNAWSVMSTSASTCKNSLLNMLKRLPSTGGEPVPIAQKADKLSKHKKNKTELKKKKKTAPLGVNTATAPLLDLAFPLFCVESSLVALSL